MKKLRSLGLTLILALSQMPPPVLAQQASVPYTAPQTSPSSPPAPSAISPQGGYDSYFGIPNQGSDLCGPVSLTRTAILPSLVPPNAWRDQHLNLYVDLRQDGSVVDVHLLRPSGQEALDAAVMAQVRQNWHWAPLACNRTSSGTEVTVRIPRATCRATGWAPPPPLTMAQQDRSVTASVDFTIQPDGRMTELRLGDSSGDAALDAALLTHIRQNWQYWPLAEGCPPDRKHAQIRFRDADCTPLPVLASRTLPDVAPQDRPRAVDFQVGVNHAGKVLFANLVRSSGDATLDAAAAAHVKAAWRWQPLTCKRSEVYARGEALPVLDLVHVPLPTRGGV